MDTWSTSTDVATVADIQIDGNDVKQYTGLNFAEIEFTSAPIDASAMTHLHLDIWTPNPTSAGFLQIRLVDLGGDNTPGGVDDTQGEVQSNTTDAVVGNYNGSTLEASATGKWLSVDLPLSTFTANGLASLTNLGQMRIAGNLSTLFVDNVYFYNEPAAATASGLTDTDPASGAGDAHRAFRGANPEATRQALRDLGIQGTAPTGKEKN